MKKNKWTVLLFVLPCLLLFTVFGIGPILPPAFYSLFEYKNFKLGEFVGLANYIKVFQDKSFWTVILNNLKLMFFQFLIGAPISFITAILISASGAKVRSFFKTASFLPYVLSVTVVCSMFSMMFQPRWGLVEWVLTAVGLEQWCQPWLSRPVSMYNIAIVTVIWQAIGYNMLLYYSGMKAIPDSYYDAARIDGADLWQQVIYITFPLLKETLKFVTILMTTGTLAMLANVKILTDGARLGDKSYTTIMYLHQIAFGEMNYGYGYAITVVYALITFAIIQLINKAFGKERTEYD